MWDEGPQDPRARAVVDFWLGDSLEGPEQAERRRAVWYEGGAPFDEAIQRQFGDLIEPALAGDLDHWAVSPGGALALVIILDQFTRNTFRHTPRAYAGDARALPITRARLDDGSHRRLPVTGRIFFYHPLHHAESLALQDEVVALVDAIRHDLGPEWQEYMDRRVAGFTRHRNIVARFGRFPHRNSVLGRESTAEEAEYLSGDHESFGQGPAGR